MLYAIQVGEGGPIKIGFSDDPAARLCQIQTGNPQQCILLGTIDGGLEREADIHAELAEFRVRGEWFLPCPAVMDVVNGFTPWSPVILEAPASDVVAASVGASRAAAYKWRKRGVPIWAQLATLKAAPNKDAA